MGCWIATVIASPITITSTITTTTTSTTTALKHPRSPSLILVWRCGMILREGSRGQFLDGHGRRGCVPLNIRNMQEEDLPLGLDLCRVCGWNQTEMDWRRLLTLSPEGVFAAEYKGQPCATACATRYGSASAWIGMVLVHPEFRRRGIGSALMRHCIDFLKSKRVDSIKIDASEQGRPVYLKIGFDDERPVFRYLGAIPAGLKPDPKVVSIDPSMWTAIAAMDVAAFGADRMDLLRLLDTHAITAALPKEAGIAAYGFAREGLHASYVGPIVASDAESARRVLTNLLSRLPGREVYWDVLPDNVAAKALATELGFAIRRRFTRMYLGEALHAGDMDRVFGTAGLELG